MTSVFVGENLLGRSEQVFQLRRTPGKFRIVCMSKGNCLGSIGAGFLGRRLKTIEYKFCKITFPPPGTDFNIIGTLDCEN